MSPLMTFSSNRSTKWMWTMGARLHKQEAQSLKALQSPGTSLQNSSTVHLSFYPWKPEQLLLLTTWCFLRNYMFHLETKKNCGKSLQLLLKRKMGLYPNELTWRSFYRSWVLPLTISFRIPPVFSTRWRIFSSRKHFIIFIATNFKGIC